MTAHLSFSALRATVGISLWMASVPMAVCSASQQTANHRWKLLQISMCCPMISALSTPEYQIYVLRQNEEVPDITDRFSTTTKTRRWQPGRRKTRLERKTLRLIRVRAHIPTHISI